MNRLTKKHGVIYPQSEEKQGEIYLKLATYEDTNLDPSEIAALKAENEKLKRALELACIDLADEIEIAPCSKYDGWLKGDCKQDCPGHIQEHILNVAQMEIDKEAL